MKNFMKLLAVMLFGLISLVSCQSEISEPETQSSPIKVDIKVADISSNSGTRAAKTSWCKGDKIHLFFSGNSTRIPDLTLTFNGNRWSASEISPESQARLHIQEVNSDDTPGFLIGFWESSNQAYTDQDDYFEKGTASYKTFLKESEGTEISYSKNSLCFVVDETIYSFDGTTLSAGLSEWFPGCDLQFSVSGIQGDDYVLFVEDAEDRDIFRIATLIYFNGYSYYISGEGNKGALGTPGDGEVSFVFTTWNAIEKGDVINLSLLNLATGELFKYQSSFPYDYYYGTASLLNFLKIDFSKFEKVEND